MTEEPKQVGLRVVAMVVALGACAHNVPQDLATGKDGNVKGALAISLEHNEGQAVGIVTYPGGDRVDWRSIEIPAGKHGTLDLKLTYSTPRPNLKVEFDVFDQWHAPVAKSAYHRSGHTRTTTVDGAKGTYLVRVYAPRRGDAGKYKLVADFNEELLPPPQPMIQIPDPPRLAEVPPPELPCDPFDPKNDTCKKHCDAMASPSWPGCKVECPDPADAKFPACQTQMVCGAVPDPRIAACNKPAPLPPPVKPVTARAIKVQVDGDGLLVWLATGSAFGVGKDWSGGVLRSGSDKLLPGGGATIVQVNKTTVVVRVHITQDALTQNDQITLHP